MNGDKSKIQLKAENKIVFLKTCKIELEQRITDEKKEKNELLAEALNFNEKIKQAANSDDELDFAKKAIQINEKIKNIDKLLWVFRTILTKFTELLDHIQIFYNWGDYKYIIKKVHEKKLSGIVGGNDSIGELYMLVGEVISEFDTRCKKLKSSEFTQYKPSRLNNELDISDVEAETYIKNIKGE